MLIDWIVTNDVGFPDWLASVLIAAIATGNAVSGGILMLAFGLGTLPTLLTMGITAARLKTVLQNIWVRRASGLLVLSFGLVGLLRVI